MVETVGVGQVEVEVAGKADTTVVVVNPGWGDSVQANKAGLMEVADVFAINKADRPGVPETMRDLNQMLELSAELAHDADPEAPLDQGWRVPILPTVGQSGEGVPRVVGRRRWPTAPTPRPAGCWTPVAGSVGARSCREIVARRLEQRAREIGSDARWDGLTEAVVAGEIDPWSASDEMLDSVL